MKHIIMLLIFICILCQRSIAQDIDELAHIFHTQLNERNYVKAKSTMLLLNRKLTYQLLIGNNCLFSEYLNLCKENNIEIDELKEAALYVDMLRDVYKDAPDKVVKNLKQSLKCFCDENHGVLSEWFFECLQEDTQLELADKLNYQYQIAWAYNGSLNPYKAWQLFKHCAEQYSVLDSTSIEYANSLNGMAYECQYLGRDEMSLSLYKKIEQIYACRYGRMSKRYAINCDNIGRTFLKVKNEPDSALIYMNRAYDILKSINDTTHDMGIVLNNMACCYGALNNRDKELEYLNNALQYCEDSSIVFRNIGYLYKINGDISNALESYKKTDESYQVSLCATDIAECYAALGDYEKFYYYEKSYFSYYKTVIRNNFREMIGSDRSAFCIRGRNCNVDSLFRISSRLNIPNLAKLCYDYLVFEKSQSLSCDQSIESIIKTTSQEVKDKYSELVRTKETSKGNTIEYELLETEFLKLLKKEVDYTNFLQVTHKEIGEKLKCDEIAIEFYTADEHDDNRIYALVLNSSGDVNIINLCTIDNKLELENIWKKLYPYLIGVKKIFFSPDGILHTFPIESYLSQKDIALYRLSSTRELVLNHRMDSHGSVIYGGLYYDTPISQLEANAKIYQQKKNGNDIDDIYYRGAISNTIPYLEGTKKEAEAIADICNRVKSHLKGNVELFIEDAGTEASFYSLSGQRIRLIHIGTHGFYNKEKKDFSNYNQGDFIDNRLNSSIREDHSLRRCGLLFSGAENYLDEKMYNLNSNDGILTAQDISMLDLRGLDLVSLSACETGLGDITGDGVFGLQRGFKKAGANSILMSLWKVDDAATCLLMTEFYRNWMNGKSKHDALESAKKVVRSHKDKGWDNPKYWAAFILLDGLD